MIAWVQTFESSLWCRPVIRIRPLQIRNGVTSWQFCLISG
uniref:Uncharacterized protein n=1 Tax=Anguilla anguilla TaxID=7936 RepID=A0A0E9QDZ5_ANGAN